MQELRCTALMNTKGSEVGSHSISCLFVYMGQPNTVKMVYMYVLLPSISHSSQQIYASLSIFYYNIIM